MGVRVSIEGARGCGYRQPGGLYLVASALAETCSRLPLQVGACPTCGAGVKPARGFTWIQPIQLWDAVQHGSIEHNARCPIGAPGIGDDRAGLLWIGEKFYPTPQDFLSEAARMGVSRRIIAVPRGFAAGETWIFLGHRKGVNGGRPNLGDDLHLTPAIVTAFQPTAIEYIVKGDESDEELAAMEERGLALVQVVRDTSQASLGLDDEEDA